MGLPAEHFAYLMDEKICLRIDFFIGLSSEWHAPLPSFCVMTYVLWFSFPSETRLTSLLFYASATQFRGWLSGVQFLSMLNMYRQDSIQ
jgi:hypothetical protein